MKNYGLFVLLVALCISESSCTLFANTNTNPINTGTGSQAVNNGSGQAANNGSGQAANNGSGQAANSNNTNTSTNTGNSSSSSLSRPLLWNETYVNFYYSGEDQKRAAQDYQSVFTGSGPTDLRPKPDQTSQIIYYASMSEDAAKYVQSILGQQKNVHLQIKQNPSINGRCVEVYL